jgi:hypothetical protein
MMKSLELFIFLLYFKVDYCFGTYLSLDGNEWTAISHNKCSQLL